MSRSRTLLLLLSLFVVFSPAAWASDAGSPNDNARVLAGLPPSEGSPLSSVVRDPSWQQHARHFNSTWATLEQRQLPRIRNWSAANITHRMPVMYYMFSGPDFLYANAVYPSAPVYILSGLEPVGEVPDVARLRSSLARDLRGLQLSLNAITTYGFFITKKMKYELTESHLTGTLPILYVFLARSGKTVKDVSLIALDSTGAVLPRSSTTSGAAKGAKIVFSQDGGPDQTLYYFSTDVSDPGVRNSGFLKFCDSFGQGESLLKSASYLLHSGSFSKVRDFLLDHSQTIVEDDSGIPVSYLKRSDWTLKPFGRYLGPIELFPGRFQAGLSEVFRKNHAVPLDFAIGYRWHGNESNLLLAVKEGAGQVKMPPAAAAPKAAAAPAAEAPAIVAAPAPVPPAGPAAADPPVAAVAAPAVPVAAPAAAVAPPAPAVAAAPPAAPAAPVAVAPLPAPVDPASPSAVGPARAAAAAAAAEAAEAKGYPRP